MDVTAVPGYVFGWDHREDQHRALSAAYDPLTTARLAETGVGDGWRCLDVGAGNASVAEWLAGRVAPSGHVLATDLRPLRDPGHPLLTVAVHDVVADPLPENAFDLIAARVVLRHLPERDAVLDTLVRALAPGGVLQVDEFDTTYEPPPVLAPDERARALYTRLIAAKSAIMTASDVPDDYGRRVPEAMRAAGLTGIDVRAHLSVREPGSPDLLRLVTHTFQLRDALNAAGLSDRDLDDVRAAMADPAFRAPSCVLYSTQGRKPR